MTFRTASGEQGKHEGVKILHVVTENGLQRKLTCAVTDVREMLLATSQLGSMGYFVGLGKYGGYIENTKDGSRIPVRLKNGIYMIKLWVLGVRLGQCGPNPHLKKRELGALKHAGNTGQVWRP